jgi:small subunit ribosomal protein S33
MSSKLVVDKWSSAATLTSLPQRRAMSNAAPLPELPEDEVARLKEASIQIFGNLPQLNPPLRTGNKVLRKKLVGPLFDRPNDQPFEDVMRKEFPDFLTEKEERRRAKLSYLRRRGKGPPKKGEGKRAMKAKKGKK